MGIVFGLRLQAGEMYVLVYSFIYELVVCEIRRTEPRTNYLR